MRSNPIYSMLTDMVRKHIQMGDRVVLLEDLEDRYRPLPEGLRGTVQFWDDADQLHVRWDNGSGLALMPGVDDFRKLTHEEILIEQLSKICDLGRLDMTDFQAVHDMAFKMECFELVRFMEEHPEKYLWLLLERSFEDN